MKRLQPLHNKTAAETLFNFFALPDLLSATLITCDQCMQNEVEEGSSEINTSVLSYLRDVNF